MADRIVIPAGSEVAHIIAVVANLHRQSITAETFALRDHLRAEAGRLAFDLIDLVDIK